MCVCVPDGKIIPYESYTCMCLRGFPGGSDSKESAYNAGDPSLIPGLGRSSGEGNDNPLQCSYLGNPKDRGAWWATVHGVSKNQTHKRLSTAHKECTSE